MGRLQRDGMYIYSSMVADASAIYCTELMVCQSFMVHPFFFMDNNFK